MMTSFSPSMSMRISTHALLAEGDIADREGAISASISTHALLAEGDGV